MIKKISMILGILLFIIIFPKNETMAGDLLNKGWYTITTKESPSYRLGVDDSKTGIKVQPANNKTGQKFLLTPLGDNLYTLGTGVTAGKYVIGNGQKTYLNQAGQKWQIIKNSDNTYSFKNKSDNKMMGYAGNLSTKPYCKRYDADSNNVKQKFIIKPVNNTYTVTFVNAEGKPIKRQAVESGKAATAPASPEKTGYTFNGWDTIFSKVTKNLTVKPTWKAKTVKVIFHRNIDVDDTATYTETYTYGVTGQFFGMKSSDKQFGGWSRTNYTLSGWTTEPEATKINYAKTNVVGQGWIDDKAGTIHLYAVWNGQTNGEIRLLRSYNDIAVKTGFSGKKEGEYKFYGNDITEKELLNIPWIKAAASPTTVKFNNKVFMYFRGEGATTTEDLISNYRQKGSSGWMYLYKPGSYTRWDNAIRKPLFKPTITNEYKQKALKKIEGKAPSDIKEAVKQFDSKYCTPVNWVSDPFSFVYNGKVYILYEHKFSVANKNKDPKTGDYVFVEDFAYLSHAVSTDGENFTDYGKILTYNTKGEEINLSANSNIFVKDNYFYMSKGKNIMQLSVTTNETNGKITKLLKNLDKTILDTKDAVWTPYNDNKLTINKDEVFRFQLNGGRFFKDGHYLYYMYSVQTSQDYPEGFGLARAKINSDITKKENWEIYPYNPIMIRGPVGAADGAAVWGLWLHNNNGIYHAYYEGCGTGSPGLQDTTYAIKERRIKYHAYRFPGWNYSKIMYAKLNTNDLRLAWSKKPIEGDVYIQNQKTKEYLSVTKDGIVITSETKTPFNISYELITNKETEDISDDIYCGFAQIKYKKNTLRPEEITDKSKIKSLWKDDENKNGLEISFNNIINSRTTENAKMLWRNFKETARTAVYFKGVSNIVAKNLNSAKNLIPENEPQNENGTENNWESKRGIQWLLYSEGNNTYTIQNRATGTFLNSPEKGKVNQAQINNQGTNDNTHWIITKT